MEKRIKVYTVDGKNMQFDSYSFEKMFVARRKEEQKSVLEMETELAEELSVSSNAIHNWRFGESGPSDIERVKELAALFKINDYTLLLKERRELKNMQITERQKNSLKRIYDVVIEYLDIFCRTNGFNDLWYKLHDQGVKASEIENMLYDIAEDEVHKVRLVLEKEYIELYKLDIYSDLEEYVYNILNNTYNEKLGYAYRFEAGVENVDGTRDTVTTGEDYTIAIKKINELLEPYM